MTDDPPTEHDELAEALEDARTPASADHGNPPDRATELSRGARLVRLRAARMSYQQIAEREGYSDRSAARHALIRALERHEAENVTELRALENEAIDEDERTLRTIISNRELPPALRIRAIDSRTRVSARRSRLNGLDAPLQVQLSAGVAADLADALAEAEAVFSDVVPGFVVSRRDEPPADELREG